MTHCNAGNIKLPKGTLLEKKGDPKHNWTAITVGSRSLTFKLETADDRRQTDKCLSRDSKRLIITDIHIIIIKPVILINYRSHSGYKWCTRHLNVKSDVKQFFVFTGCLIKCVLNGCWYISNCKQIFFKGDFLEKGDLFNKKGPPNLNGPLVHSLVVTMYRIASLGAETRQILTFMASTGWVSTLLSNCDVFSFSHDDITL